MSPARGTGLPVRFADAERIDPFQILLDLHDHAVGRPVAPSRREALAELALAAAVMSWWSRWQPQMIHAALRTGAGPADIATATGLDPDEVVRRWRRWTDVRPRPSIDGRPAVNTEEVRTVQRCLRTEADR